MRAFIAVLVLIFSLQSWTRADDISDFQIDGISIGDSLLDYFSEEEINNEKIYNYKSKKYAQYVKVLKNSNYEQAILEFKDSGKYIVGSVTGRIIYNNNDFNKCSKQERTILVDLKKMFEKDADYKNPGITAHPADTSGKSKRSRHVFVFNDGSGVIFLGCHDWSKEFNSRGLDDELKVTILGSAMNKFLINEAY